MSDRVHVPAWRRYLRFFAPRVVDDVDAELRFHFEMRVEEYIARGMSDADARAAVLRRLGDVNAARAECCVVGHREQRREARVERFDTLLQDLRLVARSLVRQRAWTAVVIVTLALGIGANSALFAIINAVLLRPLPYPHSEQIVSVSERDKDRDREVVSTAVYAEWRRAPQSVSAIAATVPTNATLDGGNDPESVRGMQVTASYFRVMAMQPERGRVFTDGEDRPDGPRVVVISDQLWRTRFGADSMIVGRVMQMDGVPTTVIGVMPPSFTQPSRAQLWTPLRIAPVARSGATFYYFVVARLRPNTSIQAARAELSAIEHRLEAGRPVWEEGFTANVLTLHDRWYGDSRPALLLLLGAVGVLLVIACANVSNLLLARAARRQREFAVRVALGASGWRIVRYLLCESILLSLAGGALGLLIPIAAIGSFVRSGPGSIATAQNIHVDGAVLAFTFVVAIITGVVFGLVPAWSARRGNVSLALSRGGTHATASRSQNRLRHLLVVAELGTALVLLTVAGLLTRSFAHVLSIDPGFQPRHVLSATIRLPHRRYSGVAAATFFTQLMERVRALPGVQSATLVNVAPLAGGGPSFAIADKNGKPGQRFAYAIVDPHYFETVGATIVAGRGLNADDRAGAPPVVVINATMARGMFPGVNPVGQVLRFGKDTVGMTIVGVAKDVLQRLEAAPDFTLFRPIAQEPDEPIQTVLVRTAGAPETLALPIREAARAIDPALPPPVYTAMDDVLSQAVAPRRFTFMLLGVLASLAATLAAVGLYGVMAYLVADRAQEIGVRMALGAEQRQVVGQVVGHGMWLTAAGIVLGLVGSLGVVRLLRTMLYQVSIYDPSAFVGGAVLLAAVALLACYLPARRAARVDPVIALRAE